MTSSSPEASMQRCLLVLLNYGYSEEGPQGTKLRGLYSEMDHCRSLANVFDHFKQETECVAKRMYTCGIRSDLATGRSSAGP